MNEDEKMMVGLLFLCIILIGLLVALICEISELNEESCNTSRHDINLIIDEINKNCGSSFITKKYGTEGYYVFRTIESDGWRKSEYIPLDQCLKGEE